MEGDSTETAHTTVGSTVSRRRFLAASVAGCGAMTAGWNLIATADESRQGNASTPPVPSSESDQWAGLLEDDEKDTRTEPTQGLTHDRHTLLEGTIYETALHVVDAPHDGPTAFVVGGMHGDERSGHRVAEDVTTWSIERGRLVVLPAANSVALGGHVRNGLHGDLNRQFPSSEHRDPTTELAQAIWDAVVSYDPDWLADLHSSAGIYRSGDGGVGQAIFPSFVVPARRYAAAAVKAVTAEFDLPEPMAYERGDTLNADQGMLAYRASKLLDIPTFILETTEKLSLGLQVELHTVSMESLLRSFDHT